MTNKTYLFIDGTNLYAGQYELYGPGKYLHFGKFIKNIKKELNVHFDRIYFYASFSPKPKRPSEKQKLFLKNEAFFYKSVKQTPRVIFFKGYRSKTSGKEKEVDVKLAVDIVDFAHRNDYNQLFLMSGDADFMEALFTVRKLNKKINVLCLENKVIFKSLAFFNTYIVLVKASPRFKKLTKIMVQNLHKLKIDRQSTFMGL